MTFARVLVVSTGIVFVVIGAGFLLKPVAWARTVGIELPTPTARIDLMATYGGFDLAFGLFLLYCAWRPESVRIGLVACLFALVGFGATRALGLLAIRGPVQPILYWLLALEAVGVVLCWLALRSD